ncbi:MAG: flagellar hook-associated protein FlgK [Acidobacteriia bacterium]|nr:flagellar hook-associated protein FlgK [Terriglobia bacterium]
MPNLFADLTTAGQSLGVFQQALNTVQNNITNANTPGFASQSLNLSALPFDVVGGLAGGVASQGLKSARNEYADEAVRRQMSSLGAYDAQAQATSAIAANFDPSGNSGVPAALNQFFQSISSWSLTPNDAAARQQVLANAGTLASSVQNLTASLSQQDQSIQSQIGNTVQQINSLTAQIQHINIEQLHAETPDPGLDAQMHSALEQLSQLTDFSQIKQADGTVTVVLSGGTPLVVGDQQFTLSATTALPAGAVNPTAPPTSQILDSQGKTITSQIQGGQLAGLLDTHNRVLASILGDGMQAGSLNQFAKGLADTVNGILTSGTVSVAAGAASGKPLFVYNGADATTAASSLALNPGITGADLAPVDSAGNSNGNALKLADLATSASGGGVGGQTFGQFFAGIAQYVGNANSTATTNQTSQQQIVTQTEALRDQISHVSLDEQAILLTQFQKSYEAAAKLISVLNSVTETTINMVQ